MHVHIICRDPQEETVLPYLARTLATGTNWSLSEEPDRSADLNYWIIYIDFAERHSDFHFTPTAAYFSHFESDNPRKSFWWDLASRTVDIKVITIPQDKFPIPGEVLRVIPPVDTIFCPREHLPRSLPRVGVSGFVPSRSGRKGEYLVRQLAQAWSNRVEIVASGRGWPAKIINERRAGLPNFYNSLDVLLCTSLIEGIPMPPLEALACATPVVIPRGVGILDELPEMEGIARYTAGDFNSMCRALEEALETTSAKRQLLPAAIRPYCAEAWCKSHQDGFERILCSNENSLPPKLESSRHGERGVVYVAFGGPARRCATAAIGSLRTYMPDLSAAVISDQPLGVEDIFIPHEDLDIGGRLAKVRIDELAPREWQYILYLDADTEIIADVSFLFEVLEDGWDMVICKNPNKYHSTRWMARDDNRDECEYTFEKLGCDDLLQLNGGVFAFQRNIRTHKFFAAWIEEWKQWGKRDQAALLRALFRAPVKLYTLGNEWNTITRYQSRETSAGILHFPMTARRHRGLVRGRLDSKEAWRAVERFQSGERDA